MLVYWGLTARWLRRSLLRRPTIIMRARIGWIGVTDMYSCHFQPLEREWRGVLPPTVVILCQCAPVRLFICECVGWIVCRLCHNCSVKDRAESSMKSDTTSGTFRKYKGPRIFSGWFYFPLLICCFNILVGLFVIAYTALCCAIHCHPVFTTPPSSIAEPCVTLLVTAVVELRVGAYKPYRLNANAANVYLNLHDVMLRR